MSPESTTESTSLAPEGLMEAQNRDQLHQLLIADAEGMAEDQILAEKKAMLDQIKLNPGENTIPQDFKIGNIEGIDNVESGNENDSFFLKYIKSLKEKISDVGLDESTSTDIDEILQVQIDSAIGNVESHPVQLVSDLLTNLAGEFSVEKGFSESQADELSKIVEDVGNGFKQYIEKTVAQENGITDEELESSKAEKKKVSAGEAAIDPADAEADAEKKRKEAIGKEEEDEGLTYTDGLVATATIGLCFVPVIGPFLAAGLALKHCHDKTKYLRGKNDSQRVEELEGQLNSQAKERVDERVAQRAEEIKSEGVDGQDSNRFLQGQGHGLTKAGNEVFEGLSGDLSQAESSLESAERSIRGTVEQAAENVKSLGQASPQTTAIKTRGKKGAGFAANPLQSGKALSVGNNF